MGQQEVASGEYDLSAENLCTVPTTGGPVKGADKGASCAFLGIPFAASTGGANRWRAPQPRAPWAPATLNVTTAPAAGAGGNCPSIGGNGLPTGAEDCLKLNVWAPDPPPASPVPVILWIHTGGFIQTTSNQANMQGQNFAEKTGAIVVAPNYRLGPMGFLAHSGLAAENPASGNYGLLDQQAAMIWVRDNIAEFGGDPSNVTIAGTSAGGHSVGFHLFSPSASGLFSRAIMESGYASFRQTTQAEAFTQGNALATALGCTTPATAVACLRGKTMNQVLQALPVAAEGVTEVSGAFWQPVVDGVVVPDQPRALYEAGAFAQVPVILGAQRDEGWNFVNRSFPGAVTQAQFDARINTEFGAAAADILAAYPTSSFTSPKEAMARLYGDAEYTCEARRVARLLSDGGLDGHHPGQGGGVENDGEGHVNQEHDEVATFLYSFNYELDTISLDHVVHGTEANIVLGNNFSNPNPVYNLNAADKALHSAMAGYWSRFALQGDPNVDNMNFNGGQGDCEHAQGQGNGLDHCDDDTSTIVWPQFDAEDDRHIVFNAPISQAVDFGGAVCDLWDGLYLRTTLRGLPASAP